MLILLIAIGIVLTLVSLLLVRPCTNLISSIRNPVDPYDPLGRHSGYRNGEKISIY